MLNVILVRNKNTRTKKIFNCVAMAWLVAFLGRTQSETKIDKAADIEKPRRSKDELVSQPRWSASNHEDEEYWFGKQPQRNGVQRDPHCATRLLQSQRACDRS